MISRDLRRHGTRPAAVLIGVLFVVVVVTWSVVLTRASARPTSTACPPPGTPPGQPALAAARPANALDSVNPAPPGAVRIRVLNGGGQRGQANLVANQLGELGFTETGDPTNDPYYPNGNLVCRGNIRYGPNGASAARTVSLVLPCLALVPDQRGDDTVDVVIGTLFGGVHPTKAAREALDQLSGPTGQTNVGDADNSPVSPVADAELLAKARDVPC